MTAALGGAGSPSACHTHIRTSTYRWPDTDDVDGYFTVDLLRLDDQAGQWVSCDPDDSVDAYVRQHPASVLRGVVRADLPGLPDTLSWPP